MAVIRAVLHQDVMRSCSWCTSLALLHCYRVIFINVKCIYVLYFYTNKQFYNKMPKCCALSCLKHFNMHSLKKTKKHHWLQMSLQNTNLKHIFTVKAISLTFGRDQKKCIGFFITSYHLQCKYKHHKKKNSRWHVQSWLEVLPVFIFHTNKILRVMKLQTQTLHRGSALSW